jgi:hypothetical protein
LIGGAFTDRLALAPLAEALVPYFSVVAYDRRGRGASRDTALYAVSREVEDLAAVIGSTGEPWQATCPACRSRRSGLTWSKCRHWSWTGRRARPGSTIPRRRWPTCCPAAGGRPSLVPAAA